MIWMFFWVGFFFAAFATFCIISTLIAWKGVEDLRQLFLRLRRGSD